MTDKGFLIAEPGAMRRFCTQKKASADVGGGDGRHGQRIPPSTNAAPVVAKARCRSREAVHADPGRGATSVSGFRTNDTAYDGDRLVSSAGRSADESWRFRADVCHHADPCRTPPTGVGPRLACELAVARSPLDEVTSSTCRRHGDFDGGLARFVTVYPIRRCRRVADFGLATLSMAIFGSMTSTVAVSVSVAGLPSSSSAVAVAVFTVSAVSVVVHV